ncbi:hypothetical protein GFV12_08525 (plasmid) [Desulfurobacterium thermolithotrophum]|uniref:hypothetical protein n=1 Tax=Desulfurobacterium thermolithotrophum TaxID=64160 RepID=UPI0013D12D82|nr:hypothetical protein [Desulfurobacterium thermolithotrophum]
MGSEIKKLIKKANKETVKKQIKEQLSREIDVLDAVLFELGIFDYTAEELLELSGLSIGAYKVKRKDKEYKYYKVTGIWTGEKAETEEVWIVRKEGEKEERERRYRREVRQIANIKHSLENETLLTMLKFYWRRAKALKKWIELKGVL